jgi:hypothetical protein
MRDGPEAPDATTARHRFDHDAELDASLDVG